MKMLQKAAGLLLAACLILCLMPMGAAAEELPEETGFLCDYNLYFGLLHAHTDLSDGKGSVSEAFNYAAAVDGLDFFAVTDHSNSFDNDELGDLTRDGAAISEKWAAGKSAAAAVTDETFLGIFGFEMTWPEIRQLGHITTYNTPGWLSRNQDAFRDNGDALENYLDALTEAPDAVSQFCHPGKQYGTFDNFDCWTPEYDRVVQLLEVLGEGSISAYVRALDKFWHLAPTASQNCHNGNWGSENDLRTVVLAEKLTEESLFEAIRARRVYATEDKDLHICYELDGQIMGSVLPGGDRPFLTASLWDPTDASLGRVEVIAEGGVTVASQTLEAWDAQLEISLPGGYRWYFLKITQPDGDVAVTAPVWVEGFDELGIGSFSCDTEKPIQGEAVEFSWTLFNEEPADLEEIAVELYAGDTRIHRQEGLSLAAGAETVFRFSYVHPTPGTEAFRLTVRGSILGRAGSWEETLTLRFRSGEVAEDILLWGELPEEFAALIRTAERRVTTFEDHLPRGGKLLILSGSPKISEGFRQDAAEFILSGGSVLTDCTEEGLLEALGTVIRPGDPVEAGRTDTYNKEDPLLADVKAGQAFLFDAGRSLTGGSWLVKQGEAVILAAEDTGYGGRILVAGCPVWTGEQLKPAESYWDLPNANRTLLQTLLGSNHDHLEERSIAAVRSGEAGDLFRVRGYVTAGTLDNGNRFPETLYLQDDTGGIAVTGTNLPRVQMGAPLEIVGILREENGNPILEYIDHRLPGGRYHRYQPEEVSCKTAMDYETSGGKLVQIEGKVMSLTLTGDKKGVARLTVKDIRGGKAVVEIGETILSGTTGENRLAKTVKKGRTVMAAGIVHINEQGETVIRVRDCDEVVYVPPEADPSNPPTGDRFALLRAWREILRILCVGQQ